MKTAREIIAGAINLHRWAYEGVNAEDEADLILAALAAEGFSIVETGRDPDARLNEIVSFLHGEAPLEGVWFGDRHPTERGAFWWRSRLRAALPRPTREGKTE